MSMNNDSLTNEKLIVLIARNLSEARERSKTSVLYNTIINNTILKSVTTYKIDSVLTCKDRIEHFGTNRITKEYKYKHYRKNQARALKILREKLPINTALFCSRNPYSDTLYHAISDFKYLCNSDRHVIFNFEK